MLNSIGTWLGIVLGSTDEEAQLNVELEWRHSEAKGGTTA
jgi:hypothetical protein